ncbi:GatB/YqeY domain-containing protein [Listeria booriae]|uniref:GatB/YqeY domain-containing protein n=1 Tax=Listeria booriae TaxID=1552123 RepID=A0A7X0XD98_9LIST|nr:GatB/YqeY domain-containing protein [Listeria booriae]MBC1492085.1 GatB/YqeY domain-containing protein [Listeria booriae]MBC1522736.1 GatB/YqeY domain-containing protein [Listeria booriae]MBC1529254.1 GatB/YqeY domain-containing protein [Listeria booriae]
MSLLNQLNEDMKQAMRAKEKDKLSVIRMLKAALQNEAIRLGTDDLSPDDEVTILSREMKQRRDSLNEFEKAGREDLVDQLKQEIVIVEGYLPKQLSEEEIAEIVKVTIEEVGATSPADFGKVMTVVMPKVKGKADGNAVNKFVKQYLS